jgi:hypothetical protein
MVIVFTPQGVVGSAQALASGRKNPSTGSINRSRSSHHQKKRKEKCRYPVRHALDAEPPVSTGERISTWTGEVEIDMDEHQRNLWIESIYLKFHGLMGAARSSPREKVVSGSAALGVSTQD